jgi:hypothetical protein
MKALKNALKLRDVQFPLPQIHCAGEMEPSTPVECSIGKKISWQRHGRFCLLRHQRIKRRILPLLPPLRGRSRAELRINSLDRASHLRKSRFCSAWRSSDPAKISAGTTSGPRGVIGLVAGVPTAAAKGFLRAALFGEVFLTLDVILFFTWRKGKFFATQNFAILNGIILLCR